MIKHGLFRSISCDTVTAVAFTAFLMIVGTCADANAQVVQPTYVRPAKGTKVVPFTNKTVALGGGASCQIASPCTSAIYDMTAFDAVQITVQDSNTKAVADGPWIVTNLPPYIQLALVTQQSGFGGNSLVVNVLGALDKTYPMAALDSPSANHNYVTGGANPIDVIFVPIPFPSEAAAVGAVQDLAQVNPDSDVPPVIIGGVYKAIAAGTTTSVQSVGVNGSVGTAVNGAFGSRGASLNVHLTGVGTTSSGTIVAVPVSPSPATYTDASAASLVSMGTIVPIAVYAFSAVGKNEIRVQNVGTKVARCGFGAGVSATSYSFALSTSGSDSIIELTPALNQTLSCIAVGGLLDSTVVSVLAKTYP